MKEKILIIEDDKIVNTNISILLWEEGYDVLSAHDGSEGIKIAKSEIPDLIICDILMPFTNGYEVLKELSNDPSTGIIPFIFLTAKTEKDDIRTGMQLGADDYLLKPFRAQELLKTVEVRLKRIKNFKSYYSRKVDKLNVRKYTIDDKIFLDANNEPKFIQIKNIIYIRAQNQYTLIGLLNGNIILVRKSMASWEKLLPEKYFLRIHRATIINLDYLEKIEKSSGSKLLIYIKGIAKPFPVSKRYSAKLRKNII